MRITDVDPKRLLHPPSDRRTIFEGSLASQGFVINRIELLRYSETPAGGYKHPAGGRTATEYSLLTALVEMDKGTVEMKYLEGLGGREMFDSAVTFLRQYAGISSLVNRAIIEFIAQYPGGDTGLV